LTARTAGPSGGKGVTGGNGREGHSHRVDEGAQRLGQTPPFVRLGKTARRDISVKPISTPVFGIPRLANPERAVVTGALDLEAPHHRRAKR
jgi:ribosomal protein L15